MELDEIDHALVALLQSDARMPTADIARSLNLSRPTVSKRLDRLLDNGLLHLLAETDIQASGMEFLVTVGIQIQGAAVAEVATALAQLHETLVVQTVVGRYDIELVAALEDQQQLNNFLTVKVPAISGVIEQRPGLCQSIRSINGVSKVTGRPENSLGS